MQRVIKISADRNSSTAVQEINKPTNLNRALEGYAYPQQFAQNHSYLINKLKNM